jgi:hypothetical protein
MTEVIKKQILDIRDSGETNMFDVSRVRIISLRKGYFELLEFLENNKNAYVRFILTGEEK